MTTIPDRERVTQAAVANELDASIGLVWHGISDGVREHLTLAGLDPDGVHAVVASALAEDLGSTGDLTSRATVSPESITRARYVARVDGVAAGLVVLAALVDDCLGSAAALEVLVADGDRVAAGAVLAEVTAPTRALLAIERTSLNLLGHLSGIATATRRWVDTVAASSARIRDTRKTTPGLRDLDKYAVRCGGGVNHRRGLDDAVLIKDNHVAAAGGVPAALARVAALGLDASIVVQIEVDTMDQLVEALDNDARQILLDNFSEGQLVDAVRLVRERDPGVLLEASGGLTLDRAAAVAATGVDFLSVGALTHSSPQLDIGLDTIETRIAESVGTTTDRS